MPPMLVLGLLFVDLKIVYKILKFFRSQNVRVS